MQVNKHDCFGETPLQKAVQLMNTKMIKLLVRSEAEFQKNDESYIILSQHILSAHTTAHYKLLYFLLSFGINPNANQRVVFKTGLHLAAMKGDVQIISILIESGGNLFAPDLTRAYPLNEAIWFKNWEAAADLFEAMKDPEYEDDYLNLLGKILRYNRKRYR